jgi:hypothetical protein
VAIVEAHLVFGVVMKGRGFDLPLFFMFERFFSLAFLQVTVVPLPIENQADNYGRSSSAIC